MEKYFENAIDNIVKFGDTDIFPFPIENYIFFDNKQETIELLLNIHDNYDEFVNKTPHINQSTLISAGYTGFRWATQIDPVWNIYYLGLVLSIAEKIEKVRIPVNKNMVFSYRYKFNNDSKMIFNDEFGWKSYNQRSLELSEDYKYVLTCDIADFYSRIYHHSLENALSRLNTNQLVVNNIMDLLQRFSNGTSYGLPVGGNASRILAELVLNETDKLLKTEGIVFCRFVDDYHIFANSKEEIYEKLIFLSEKLLENEGLTLQKTKTRIMTSLEFISASKHADQNDDDITEMNMQKKALLNLRLRYDPYSLTAEQYYENLKEELSKFDIVGILGSELTKTRVHSVLMKKLLQIIKHLSEDVKNNAVMSILNNIDILFPIFPNIMILIDDIFMDLNETVQDKVCLKIKN